MSEYRRMLFVKGGNEIRRKIERYIYFMRQSVSSEAMLLFVPMVSSLD